MLDELVELENRVRHSYSRVIGGVLRNLFRKYPVLEFKRRQESQEPQHFYRELGQRMENCTFLSSLPRLRQRERGYKSLFRILLCPQTANQRGG